MLSPILQDAKRYPAALIKALVTISSEPYMVTAYVLTLLHDFLTFDPEARARFFVRPGSGDGRLFYTPFLQLIGAAAVGARIVALHSDFYVMETSVNIAAALLSVDASDPLSNSSMLSWVLTHISLFSDGNADQKAIMEVAVKALTVLVRNPFLRHVAAEEQAIQRLVPILTLPSSQLLYEALFSLWSFSLVKENLAELERTGAAIGAALLIRAGMPLKVQRMAAAVVKVRDVGRDLSGREQQCLLHSLPYPPAS